MVRILNILVRLFVLGMVFGLAVAPIGLAQDQASASIYDAQGNLVAQALMFQLGDVVQVNIKNEELPSGAYGVHVHEVGNCESSDFSSAGGHFNPHGMEHGIANPNGAHAGDLPNLEVIDDGEGYLEWPVEDFTLVSGDEFTLFDADGSSVVIHGGPDDNMSNPSGNSGPRLACGVITAGVFGQVGEPATQEDPVAPTSPTSSQENRGITIFILPLLALLLLVVMISRAVG